MIGWSGTVTNGKYLIVFPHLLCLFTATINYPLLHNHRSMSSLQNAINIDSDDDSIVDLTEDDKPSKRPKVDNAPSRATKFTADDEFIPFYLYNTKQSMGSARYAPRPQSIQKYFRTLRETIGLDGSSSEKRFQWLIVCNYLFDVNFFLQSTMPEILTFKRVIIFYGEGVDAEGKEYWNQLLQGSGNTVEFIRLLPSDPPRSRTNPLNIKIQYGVHHTKMFLVGYDELNQNQHWQSKLRVVVHTANMVRQDVEWKTQGIYSQDFPLKSSLEDQNPQTIKNPYAVSKKRGWPFEDDEDVPFEDDLVTYLESYHYSKRQSWTVGSQSRTTLNTNEISLVNLIRLYDFSSAFAVLIPSVPGKHSGLNAKSFGYMKLQKAIKEHVVDWGNRHSIGQNEGRKSSARIFQSPVICQCSSVGSLSTKWLHDFISAVDAHALNENEVQTKSKKPDVSLLEKMKIVWPTVEEIRSSIEGYQGGNSVPGKASNVNKDFLTPLYHRWSKPGAEYNNNADLLKTAKNVPHIKTFLQLSRPTNGDSASIEWLCLTSHNLSKAALGELQNSSGSVTKVFFIRHWELGVFISPSTLAKRVVGDLSGPFTKTYIRICPYADSATNDDNTTANRVEVIVPLPFDPINPERYGNGDVPWTVDGPGKILPDAFGMIAN